MIVRFAGIVGIEDHHCLNLFNNFIELCCVYRVNLVTGTEIKVITLVVKYTDCIGKCILNDHDQTVP